MRLKTVTNKRWKRAGTVRYLSAFSHYQSKRWRTHQQWRRDNALEGARVPRLGVRGHWVITYI